MKRSAFDDRRDQATAEDAYPRGFTPDQMCSADHCPSRWSIASTKLCSAHHGAPKLDWPLITQRQRNADTEAILVQQNTVPPVVPKLTRDEKLGILAKLRSLFVDQQPKDPKAWAKALRARERAGERLSVMQRACWRIALGEGDTQIAPDDDPLTQRLKRETDQRVREYAKRFGIPLEQSEAIHARPPPGTSRARAFPEARTREGFER